MQNRVDRVNVGVMMAGQGRPADVFAATASFMKERKRKEEEALRAKRKYSPAQEEARRWVGGRNAVFRRGLLSCSLGGKGTGGCTGQR
jgi:hypothetical protein